ncbi:MAG: restriction endonuclease [Phycisphaerales bacterium]
MSTIGKHHAEWLQLCEPSGPFLSRAVLVRRLPQGLNKHDPELFRELKLKLDEWEEAAGTADDLLAHQQWIRFVLGRVLEMPTEVITEGQSLPAGLEVRNAATGEAIRPEMAVVNPADLTDHGGPGKPRLLIGIYRRDQKLESPVNTGGRWIASPATRMAELLHATGCSLGLVTNGEHWMIVHAKVGDPSGFASWYASLWRDEKITLQAFRTLLGVRRFFAVGHDDTLEAILTESRQDQQEVTDQLGYQVRRAVEVIVHAIDRIDKDRKRELLRGVAEPELYEGALTVMMRLVFLFCAEERKLLLLGEPLYDQHYAVSTLAAQLRETADKHGEEVLEFRTDAWCRLLTTFRAVFGGIEHDRLRLMPYGGGLFDPDRFPFLEGRRREPGRTWRNQSASPLPINNRTVLHLLEALQFLQIKMAGGPAEPRRLSFRALDIEQIGHVYEGLLDHTAKKAGGPVLGLTGTREHEPEIPLATLEAKLAAGKDKLIEVLTEETGRSAKAITKDLDATDSLLGEGSASNPRLLAACDNDAALLARVRPFAALIRADDLGYPIVVNTGSFFVTQGQDRSDTGTEYTPRSLTEPVVQHTLDPLVFNGPADGSPREQWVLRSSREILALKVCDMACGSGAFLVQAARYLSERLVESWEAIEAANPGKVIVTPEGDLSKGDPGERPLPKGREERLAVALRVIAQRCLFGVDLNPLACEMAKLSLWLLTVAKDKPFTFLDHAVRCGDSLLGLHDIEQLKRFTLDPTGYQQFTFSGLPLTELIATASTARSQLESIDSSTIGHIAAQGRLLQEAENRTVRLKLAADLLIVGELAPEEDDASREDLRNHAATQAGQFVVSEDLTAFRDAARAALKGKRPFHWCLEFPEVFNHAAGGGGFAAIIGNPPFKGGQKLTGIFGDEYREYLVKHLGRGQRGSADLVAYFFLRMASLLRAGGHFGLIATNTIAQGDTREVGLDQLVSESHPDRVVLTRAVPSRPWPGGASLEVAHVYGRSIREQAPGESWRGPFYIDDAVAPGITSFLTPPGRVVGKPHRLKANEGKSFQGSIVLGMGFVMTPEEARGLIARDPRNAEVLMPYLNGEDLNSRPDQSPSRWVINFRDWPLKREALTLPGGAKASWTLADEKQRKAWLRTGIVPQDHTGPVAADFPDCLRIVEEKVKPERTRKDENGEFVQREPLPTKWWIYAEKRPALYGQVSEKGVAAVTARVSAHHFLAPAPTNIVYSDRLVVLVISEAIVGLLSSAIHDDWAHRPGSTTHETRNTYFPEEAFETFPFPAGLTDIGATTKELLAVRTAFHSSEEMGLRELYNRVHDKGCTIASVKRVRDAHAALDRAVVAAYGWDDLIERLRHGFYPTKQGERFTIHPDARAEILARLLALNHERHAKEVASGLHAPSNGKAKSKGAKPKAKKGEAAGLFKEGE